MSKKLYKLVSFILCITVLFSTTITFAAISQGFSDLGSDNWAYSAVMNMFNKGVIAGFEDGTFRPNDPVKRAQFAKILVLALNLPLQNPDTPTFADVTKNDWSYQYVETAKQYLPGYRQGHYLYFKGNDTAVREDMAFAIVTAKGMDTQTPNLGVLDAYTDKSTISVDLRGYIALAIANKVMEGYCNGSFGAQSTLTRAEACALIYKSSIGSSRKGEKVAVKDSNIGTQYKIFNDGNMTFEYPTAYIFAEEDNKTTNDPNYWLLVKSFPYSLANGDNIYIESKYTTYTSGYTDSDINAAFGTTLDETYKFVNRIEREDAVANNQTFNIEKHDNCVISFTSSAGQGNMRLGEYRIYGRGIGAAVPEIHISNIPAIESGNIDSSYTEMTTIKDQIVKSFNVINPAQPINKTAAKVDATTTPTTQIAPKVISAQ